MATLSNALVTTFDPFDSTIVSGLDQSTQFGFIEAGFDDSPENISPSLLDDGLHINDNSTWQPEVTDIPLLLRYFRTREQR